MSANPINLLNDYKIFKTYEQILDDLENEFIFSINNTLFPKIKIAIKKDMKKYKPEWRLSFQKYQDHRIPLFLSILNISRNMISSGNYHSFRGVLGVRGEELRQVFDLSLKHLIDVGFTNKKEAQLALKELKESIDMVG